LAPGPWRPGDQPSSVGHRQVPRIEVDDTPLSPIDRRPVEGAELTCSIGR
jgi:hypothetical protein